MNEKMTKRKLALKKSIYTFINNGGVTVLIAIIVIVIFICRYGVGDTELIDWTIFTSIVIAMLLDSISRWITKILMNKLEDDIKLTTDYVHLTKKYLNQKISYNNEHASTENLNVIKEVFSNGVYNVELPVICEIFFPRNEKEIRIEDSLNEYQLPDNVRENFDDIFEAHRTSNVYNQQNIRVVNWETKGEEFLIQIERTTYFNSLVTNRAMDYKWKNGLTIREMYECGPYLNPLNRSKLSNHLGFNGFVESADGYIMLIKRGDNLSIGKRRYGCSVEASLKAKYVLGEDGHIKENGLIYSILREIEDELKIPKEHIQNSTLKGTVIAAYRDLVEGGKPQLFVVAKSKWNKEQIYDNFMQKVKQRNKKEMLEDGNKLIWIRKDDSNKIVILNNCLIYQGNEYPMMPSSLAAMVLYIKYLQSDGKWKEEMI